MPCSYIGLQLLASLLVNPGCVGEKAVKGFVQLAGEVAIAE